MSMYSHSSPPYNQIPSHPSFPYPSYPTSYQYGPPSSSYLLDPTSFRRDYMTRLSELTVNSRPIIQNLSMVAQEYSRYADVVTECIEQHIRRVPPWIKLPAWYLLDAISKNVYEPFARHFASVVASLFLDTYDAVDQNTRSKMEEMLLTWRSGAPNGRELFGVGPQVAIERGIWSGGSGGDTFQPGSGFISKSQVISELEFTLGQMERAVQINPYDAQAQSQINVLQQLRKLVEAGVSQKELQQILNQLRTMARPPSIPPPAPAPSMKYPPTSNDSYYLDPAPYSAPPPSLAVPPQPQYEQSFTSPESFEPAPPASTTSSPSYIPMDSVPPAPVASTSAAPAISNINNLFEALLKAGVVSSTGTPTSVGKAQPVTLAAAQQPVIDAKPENEVDPVREGARVYREAILSETFKLSTVEISRRRPRIVDFLYNRLPVQCKQCGIRFMESSHGKKEMQEHLDIHFKQNRKASEHVGRGHSRCWFVAVDDWIHDNGKGKGPADPSRPSNMKAAAAANAAKRDAELRAQFVVVPPGDEAKTIACPICKETLKSEFQEDDEEWVWKNAVNVDGRIYHATCHAEALSSTTTLAAKLRQELTSVGRSRSTTPERASKLRVESESPRSSARTQIIGVKRKAEPMDESSIALGSQTDRDSGDRSLGANMGESSGEPPVKKVVISATA